jgi:hypothetical protein
VQIVLTFSDLRSQNQRLPDIGLVRHPTPLNGPRQRGSYHKRIISIERGPSDLIKIITRERLDPRHK